MPSASRTPPPAAPPHTASEIQRSPAPAAAPLRRSPHSRDSTRRSQIEFTSRTPVTTATRLNARSSPPRTSSRIHPSGLPSPSAGETAITPANTASPISAVDKIRRPERRMSPRLGPRNHKLAERQQQRDQIDRNERSNRNPRPAQSPVACLRQLAANSQQQATPPPRTPPRRSTQSPVSALKNDRPSR